MANYRKTKSDADQFLLCFLTTALMLSDHCRQSDNVTNVHSLTAHSESTLERIGYFESRLFFFFPLFRSFPFLTCFPFFWQIKHISVEHSEILQVYSDFADILTHPASSSTSLGSPSLQFLYFMAFLFLFDTCQNSMSWCFPAVHTRTESPLVLHCVRFPASVDNPHINNNDGIT